jgi:hypothetical protein
MSATTEKSLQEIAREISKRYTREGTGYADRLYQLAYAIEKALCDRDERAAGILETRASELQVEWERPPCAENGFIAMVADTPAGYATWWGMGQLRKLAVVIRGKQ